MSTEVVVVPYIKSLILLVLISLTACSPVPTQPTTTSHKQTTNHHLLDYAYSYLGTPYQYGGTSRRGMDCSGLVYTVFSNENMFLPRTSYQQSKSGRTISRQEAQPGDLIFFRTSGRNISHVGIISEINGQELRFIHSSESKGVIISSSENVYWKPRFVKVVRVTQ